MNAPCKTLGDWLGLEQYRDVAASGLCQDSRDLQPGEVFVALSGTRQRIADYVAQAIERGAAAIVHDSDISLQRLDSTIPVVGLSNLDRDLPELAGRFWGYPGRELNLIGVTGTNGKSTVVDSIAKLAGLCAERCASLGTLGLGLTDDEGFTPTSTYTNPPYTTPPPAILHRLLHSVVQSGCSTLAMEVSSHALKQGRVDGLPFNIVVFTNLSHEHLDYHADLNEYFQSKRKLFTTPGLRHAVINMDDDFGKTLASDLAGEVDIIGYGTSKDANLCLRQWQPQPGGFSALVQWQDQELKFFAPMLGQFNAENILAALGALLAQGYDFEQLASLCHALTGVPGRMQVVSEQPYVVVDYAHTPSGIDVALAAVRDHRDSTLGCVFGCGGERDRSKRALMAQAAAEGADWLVLTSDNPRGEPAQQIMQDAMEGIPGGCDVHQDVDRRNATAWALQRCSTSGDALLIAGKGHEDHQEIDGQRYQYSDASTVRELLGGDSGGMGL